jgi:hypothetical protein
VRIGRVVVPETAAAEWPGGIKLTWVKGGLVDLQAVLPQHMEQCRLSCIVEPQEEDASILVVESCVRTEAAERSTEERGRHERRGLCGWVGGWGWGVLGDNAARPLAAPAARFGTGARYFWSK